MGLLYGWSIQCRSPLQFRCSHWQRWRQPCGTQHIQFQRLEQSWNLSPCQMRRRQGQEWLPGSYPLCWNGFCSFLLPPTIQRNQHLMFPLQPSSLCHCSFAIKWCFPVLGVWRLVLFTNDRVQSDWITWVDIKSWMHHHVLVTHQCVNRNEPFCPQPYLGRLPCWPRNLSNSVSETFASFTHFHIPGTFMEDSLNVVLHLQVCCDEMYLWWRKITSVNLIGNH